MLPNYDRITTRAFKMAPGAKQKKGKKKMEKKEEIEEIKKIHFNELKSHGVIITGKIPIEELACPDELLDFTIHQLNEGMVLISDVDYDVHRFHNIVELLGVNVLERIYLYLKQNGKIPDQTLQPRVAIEQFIQNAVLKFLQEKE